MSNGIAPTRVLDRIETLDVLRGVAICGILLMNIPEMGMIGSMYRPPYPAAWNLDWTVWMAQHVLFHGSMRGLFTLLFGAGMLLMLRRAEGPAAEITPIDVWLRRCLALLALGVVNFAVLLWPGEILWCYGVTGFVLLAFRTARPRSLLLAAALCLGALTVSDAVEGYHAGVKHEQGLAAQALKTRGVALTDRQKEAVAAVDETKASMYPKPAKAAEEREKRTHWPSVVAWSWSTWSEVNLTYWGWFDLAESLGCMLIGMALFRTGVLTGQASRATYLRLIAVGYLGGLGLRILNIWLAGGIGLDFVPASDPAWSYALRTGNFEIARTLVTLAHLGLIILLFRSGLLGRAAPLRALGRMALTTYLLHSVITSVLFYGFGLLGTIGFAGLMAMAAAIWVATGAFCLAWLRRHEMGPAEAALRAVAYGTFRAPWRRHQAEAVLAAAPPV